MICALCPFFVAAAAGWIAWGDNACLMPPPDSHGQWGRAGMGDRTFASLQAFRVVVMGCSKRLLLRGFPCVSTHHRLWFHSRTGYVCVGHSLYLLWQQRARVAS